ncbi:MAG: tetratricopeptide repeat protein [Planctomycetota bacterium]
MYSVLLCAALALALAFGGSLAGFYGWIWATVIALVLFAVSWVLLARYLGQRLQPAMARVQKQMEAGMLDNAMETLDGMLPMGRWVPMLRGQILGHMGMLAYHSGKKERAVELLEGASLRAPDARLMLACIHYKAGKTDKALAILDLAGKVNKKHALLHNTHAWMLHKNGKSDEAQALLAAFLKRDAANAQTKDNLLRLQNRTRMNMQAFDMQWWALGLEQPPQAMGQMRRAPKGFREPPKQPGRG